MSNPSQWEQIYQQDAQAPSPYATTSVTSETVLSPSSLCATSDRQLSPRGSVSKPMRRRSRASKKTPATLLNASTTNFRSLVQQFTGCPRTPFSFGSQRGPVNLNFGLGSEQNQSNIATSIMAPYGSNYSYQDTHQQLQQHELMRHQQQQQVYQEQHVASFHNGTNNNVFSTSSISRPNMEIPNGFVLDNVSFQELTRDSFSNENKNDSYFS